MPRSAFVRGCSERRWPRPGPAGAAPSRPRPPSLPAAEWEPEPRARARPCARPGSAVGAGCAGVCAGVWQGCGRRGVGAVLAISPWCRRRVPSRSGDADACPCLSAVVCAFPEWCGGAVRLRWFPGSKVAGLVCFSLLSIPQTARQAASQECLRGVGIYTVVSDTPVDVRDGSELLNVYPHQRRVSAP